MDSEDQRAQLLQMADQWEKMAADRLTLISNHPELAHEGEHEEERSWLTGRAKSHRRVGG